MGFRSVDRGRSAVVGAVVVAAVVAADAGTGAVVAVLVTVAGPAPDDPRDSRPDQTASIFFVVFCRKTIQSGLKSFAWSES